MQILDMVVTNEIVWQTKASNSQLLCDRIRSKLFQSQDLGSNSIK